MAARVLERRAPQPTLDRIERSDPAQIGQVGQRMAAIHALGVFEEDQMIAVIAVEEARLDPDAVSGLSDDEVELLLATMQDRD